MNSTYDSFDAPYKDAGADFRKSARIARAEATKFERMGKRTEAAEALVRACSSLEYLGEVLEHWSMAREVGGDVSGSVKVLRDEMAAYEEAASLSHRRSEILRQEMLALDRGNVKRNAMLRARKEWVEACGVYLGALGKRVKSLHYLADAQFRCGENGAANKTVARRDEVAGAVKKAAPAWAAILDSVGDRKRATRARKLAKQ